MSLTFSESGSVTMSKARHVACLEAAWELEVIAAMLPDVVANQDEVAYASRLRVRCLASRVDALANALMSGLGDPAVPVEGPSGLNVKVLLTTDQD